MAQLNLSLSTQKARQELSLFVSMLEKVGPATERAGKSGAGLEARLTKLAAFKGVEANAITSLDRFASSLSKASAATGNLTNVSKGLNSLARVRVDAVAANLDRMSRALASFRVPPSMARFASDLSKIASSANIAAGGIMKVSRALNTIKAAPGLSSAARSFERIGASAGAASVGLARFSRAGSVVSSTLAGFGVVLGAFGFARFIQNTYEAVRAVDRFNNIVTATQGANQVGKEMAFIRETATKLKLPIEGLVDSYGRFSAAAVSSGESVENVHKTFTAMSTAARVLKLDQEQLKLAFLGLEQMYSKGNVSMQELRRQWGEQIPGGFAIAAKAMGTTELALTDLISSGKLASTDFIPKLAEELQKTFGPGLTTALDSAQAAMDNFSNAIFLTSEAFGRGFFDAFKGTLDSLAVTMNDPAFVNGARAWGEALGTAANVALKAITFLARNFDVLKYAVLTVVGLRVGAAVGAWATGLSAAASAAAATTRTVAGMTVAVGGLSYAGGIISGLKSAFLVAATGARAFVLALGPIGIAIAALTIAVPLVIDLYNDWASSADATANANKGAASAGTAAADSANKGAAASGLFASAAEKLAAMQRAVGLGGNAAAAGTAKAGNSAANAASDYEALAQAALKANRAMNPDGASLPETSRGKDYRELDASGDVWGYAGGGIAGKPSNKSYRLPRSTFVNARSFAGGGLSDGGIPAVLHPNEAVVPLAGGGTIPVQMMSGGQSSLMLLKPLNMLVDYQKQTKTEVSRVWEATMVQTTITRNAFDRAETILAHIDNARMPDIINSIASLKTAMGSSSLGGSGSTYSSINAPNSKAEELLALMDVQIAGIAASAASANNVGSGSLTMVGGKVMAAGSKVWFEAMMPIFQAERDMFAARLNAGLVSSEELDKRLKGARKGLSAQSGFASGSPNAAKDANGGFQATLHPNEAVIPLPDGRSVPVSLPSAIQSKLDTLMSGGDNRVVSSAPVGNTRGNGGGVTIQVNISVQAKDADSFRASKDQIAREMKTSIDRATRTIGVRLDIDDPTRRG